jgi:hypothetical protein
MGTVAFDSTDKQTNGKLFTIMLINEFIAPPSELNTGRHIEQDKSLVQGDKNEMEH